MKKLKNSRLSTDSRKLQTLALKNVEMYLHRYLFGRLVATPPFFRLLSFLPFLQQH